MDRIKEGRRVSLAATNGLTRRRHRTSSLRDSPEEDGVVDLHESTSFVDRSIVKKDRDRDRERDRDRYRDRDRERERDRFSRSKKRRAERLMHGNNRENGDDESSDESVNVEEDEDEDANGATAGERVGSSMRLLPPNPSSLSSSAMANHHLHRKSFPPPSKVYKAPTTSTWRPTDEMIGVSVPRKARSASIKRSHDWLSSASGVVGEQLHRQESESPARSNGPSIPSMLSSPAPVSPSSSNASLKKKMKLNGSKPRPPKSNAKSPSSAQDEIEIEIAEVLYGMMRQPQVSSKQEIPGNDSVKSDIKDASNNKSSSADAKSRASSPISNSQSAAPHPPSILHANSSSTSNHMLTIAPKRKRPRPLKYDDDNSSGFAAKKTPNSMTTNFELDHSDHPPTAETSLHRLRRELGSVAENGGISFNLIAERAALGNKAELQSEAIIMSNAAQISDSKPLIDKLEIREMGDSKEETVSSNKASPSGLGLDNDSGNLKAAKGNSTVPQIDSQREEKIQIDLMAPPLRPCSERNGEIDFVAVNSKSIVTGVEKEERRGSINECVKTLERRKDEVTGEAVENSKTKAVAEEADLSKRVISKERNINLQLDLEKCDRDSASIPPNESLQNGQKQQQLPSHTDKIAQASSLPLQMSMASWPGGLPPMGYMPPLQGVVSMDGNTVSPVAMQPQHLPFGHPRPKRCATHCHIARNIHYHQQFSRMNPFWPAAAGSALPYGAKPCNVGVVPPTELLGNLSSRGAAQDKGQGLTMFPSHNGKDKGLQASNMADGAQRKQILIQQALPPGTPNNILHGPAFIFPISQQQAAAAASVRPGFLKSSPAAPSQGALSSTSSTATAAAAAGPAMSFSYPTMPGNEAQYLAILQNGAYPIPIPAHVGAPPAYRGSPHAQPMPFFNGSFYSSQMLHQSSQLPQQKLPSTTTQSQQGQQNPTVSSGSSSSQKHFQNQLQMQPSIGLNGGLQSFSGQKNQVSSSLQLQPRLHPHPQTHNVSSQSRQVESDVASEDNPSTPDSRVSRANMNIYGQNFSLPFTPPNFALMTPGSASNSTSANEKKHPQQQGSKGGESLPSQAFAMAFSSMNGGDISSLSQNYHVSAAPQHKKNYQSAEEVKSVRNDGSNPDEEIKAVSSGKVPTTYGQSIAFFRSDAGGNNNSVSTIPGPTVIDSSSRTLNLGSGSTRVSNSIPSTSVTTVDPSNTQHQLQLQRYQHHQQLMMVHRLQQQAQAAAVAARTKVPDHGSPSSSIAAKFPNTISAFPQNLQNSSNNPGQGQSPQWKNSVRTVTSPTSGSSTSSSLKSLPQQQIRPQQSHTQISFATNPKPSSTGGQASHQQSPSPPMMVGSPTTSLSRSAGGSPRTTASTTTGNKTGQASSLSSSQPAKSSQSVPNHKSSPVNSRNVGNTHISPSNTGAKSQLPKQQLQKQAVQQSQMMFSNAYMQQVQQSQQHPAGTNANSSTVASGGGYYLQRHQQQPPPQQSSFTTSSGMLSLSNSDPTKVISAAAASNMKGINQASFTAANTKVLPHQLVPAGFSYVQQHSVPATGQGKPNEQKQQQQGGE